MVDDEVTGSVDDADVSSVLDAASVVEVAMASVEVAVIDESVVVEIVSSVVEDTVEEADSPVEIVDTVTSVEVAVSIVVVVATVETVVVARTATEEKEMIRFIAIEPLSDVPWTITLSPILISERVNGS